VLAAVRQVSTMVDARMGTLELVSNPRTPGDCTPGACDTG